MRVKSWVAAGDTPLEAVTVNVKVPGADAVPARVPVPSPLSVKPIPWGSPLWPDPVETLRVTGVGRPGLVVTVKVPWVPAVNVALLALVIVGSIPGAASTAPMVQFGPRSGRGTPRWSTAPGPQAATPFNVVGEGITPTAGLPGAGSIVSVGPPLAAKRPRSGATLTLSVACVNPHAVPVESSVKL